MPETFDINNPHHRAADLMKAALELLKEAQHPDSWPARLWLRDAIEHLRVMGLLGEGK